MATTAGNTVDPTEIAKFSAMADEWWDHAGPFRPLHQMNPCRLAYVRDQVCAEMGRDPATMRALTGLRMLDVGCGGGLACEPLARMGADVTGVDAAAENVAVARVHAEEAGLKIDYRETTAEALVEAGEQFDAVLALEVIEHVADPQSFLDALGQLVRPGGLIILSTLNRTAQSYAVAILGAEYVLGWLPRGTHEWSRFLTPNQLDEHLVRAGVEPVDRRGMRFDLLGGEWALSADLSINYLATAVRPAR